jgi:pseudouridine synthase
VNGIVETCCNRLVSRTNDCIEVAPLAINDDTSWIDVIIPMPRYYACYKPRGVFCSNSRNVTDKLDSILISEWLEDISALKYLSSRGLQTVGRLDEESEGLLLLTEDGSFSRLLCDPEFGLEKTYRVGVRGSHYHEMMMRIQHPHDNELGVTTKDALSKQVSEMIQRGTLTPPFFTYKSCHVHDVGQLDTQHSSDDSYYALIDLVLQEGKRHAVRRIIKNASTTSTTAGDCGGGAALRVCYLSRIALERLAGVGVIMPKTLLDAQTMGFMPGVDCTRHRRMVPAGKLVCRTSSDDPLILHSGQIAELRDSDGDRIFYKECVR